MATSRKRGGGARPAVVSDADAKSGRNRTAELPDADTRDELNEHFARIGAGVSNATRFHILSLLSESERPVDSIARMSGQPVVSVSAHLKVLREAGLVIARREGRRVHYRVADPSVIELCEAVRRVAEIRMPAMRELMERYFRDESAIERIEADEVEALIDSVQRGEMVLLDLRPEEEFAAGHLPGARSLPLARLEEGLPTLDADRPIIAYCRGRWCGTAVRGTALLRGAGLDVRRLALSVHELQRQGAELVKGTASMGTR